MEHDSWHRNIATSHHNSINSTIQLRFKLQFNQQMSAAPIRFHFINIMLISHRVIPLPSPLPPEVISSAVHVIWFMAGHVTVCCYSGRLFPRNKLAATAGGTRYQMILGMLFPSCCSGHPQFTVIIIIIIMATLGRLAFVSTAFHFKDDAGDVWCC